MDFNNLTYRDLINNLSDPLQNRKFLEAMLVERTHGNRFNVRRLEVSDAKKPDDSADLITYDEAFRFESELLAFIIKQYYKVIMEDRTKLNQSMVTPNLLREENIAKIKEFSEAPIELIEVLRFDLFERGPFRDPNKTDEREKQVYQKMKEKYGLDEDLTFVLAQAYQSMCRFDEHIGRSGFGNLFVPSKDPYSIRIYLNTPEGQPTLDFAKAYIEKCVERNLDYDARFAFNSATNDRTILYSRGRDNIVERVKILEEIARENPDLIEKFGNPILDTARVNDSYYGICHAGVLSKSGGCVATYNDYFDELCEASFILMKARIMLQRLSLDNSNLREGELEFIQNISGLNKFASQASGGYGRQSALKLRYFPNFDYSDGLGDKEATTDPVGEVFRTEGLSWKDIDKKLNEILARKPELEETIQEKKKTGEIDIVSEFGSSLLMLSNFVQGRSLDAKSNVAVSKEMENLIDLERGE